MPEVSEAQRRVIVKQVNQATSPQVEALLSVLAQVDNKTLARELRLSIADLGVSVCEATLRATAVVIRRIG